MSKSALFFCKECGTEVTKWMGQCPGCRAWNTLVEAPAGQAAKLKTRAVSESRKRAAIQPGEKKRPVTIRDVETAADLRQPVGMAEFDRVLGGGIVPGSLILVGGDPGIGKSTLLLQTCRMLSGKGIRTLYVSGEESEKQIKLRADRIGDFTEGMLLFSETAMSAILEAVDEVQPSVLVVDSIQTVFEESVDAAPGSVSQVREITGVLLQLAKSRNITVFIVGHVTKEGNVAGGMRITEPALDLALVAALISSHTGKAYDSRMIFFGEVGLVGEVRAVSQAERRVREAVKTGYTTIVLPESNRLALEKAGDVFEGAKLIGVRHVRDIANLSR